MVSCLLIFRRERTPVVVLFNEILSIFLFHQCSFQLGHISVQAALSVLITNTSGQEESILDTSNSSALMCWQRLLVTVWLARMLCHIGLTRNHYQDFFVHDLPKLLEDVPPAVRARMWYMHDGALAHFSRTVRDVTECGK
jgi:hypothetical protein